MPCIFDGRTCLAVDLSKPMIYIYGRKFVCIFAKLMAEKFIWLIFIDGDDGGGETYMGKRQGYSGKR